MIDTDWLWLTEDGPLTDEQVLEYTGFVYVITCLDAPFKRYIGKKLFTAAKTKQVKGKKKKTRVPSNWRKYWGSNAELLEDIKRVGKERFSRTILKLCKSKGECSYYEAKFQFEHDVLLSPLFYNTWLSVRVRRSHLPQKGLT